jgi:acyl-CoA synthetase (NDP forming)/GNAT superfamily N-acetyltransferase
MDQAAGDFRLDVLLADGGSAHLRECRGDDQPRLEALYRRVSDRSRYFRFFSRLSPTAAARRGQVTVGSANRLMLVAEIGTDIVGVAEYDLTNDDDIAEVALVVQDDQQGRGLGTVLLEQLASVAIGHGIRRFTASFLPGNLAVREMFTDAGFTVLWHATDGGVCDAVFDLTPTPEWQRSHARREHVAERRSIERLLTPRSIAVLGVGRRDDSIGRAILENLVAGGYRGEVSAVNPHPTTAGGRPAYPSVLDLPAAPDLAVIAVSAAAVLDAARDCATAGARSVVVISGGFAELADGSSVQDELVALCRKAGMRLVGPNCIGVVNTDPAVSMNATFSPVAPERGRIGFGSQSGGVGIELLARARELGLGVSSFVSLGNKADVSGNDLLQYWADDPATDVILLYLESFGNPHKFARLAREIVREKPIVAMKSGRSEAGARGARSHTAALADSDQVVDELLRETGVIRVDTLEELFDTAALLAHQPVPAGRRVAVMSNGGGPGIIAADACIAAGLEVPVLSAPVQEQLRALAPSGAGVQNPVDLIAAAGPDVFRSAGRALLASGEVDALIVLYVAPRVTRPHDIAAAVDDVADSAGPRPVAACFLGLGRRDDAARRSGAKVPMFAFPESAARAVARAAELGVWRRRPPGVLPTLDGVDAEAARRRVAAELQARPEGGWQASEAIHEILDAYGIPLVATTRADTAAEAVAAAEHIGYPVAIKAAAPELVHKTDVGGVALDLRSASAVTDAFVRMQDALGSQMGGVVVEPMAAAGIELIAGITRDRRFGSLVVFGMGGFAAELQRDVILRIPPLTDVEIDGMAKSLRSSPLLFGYRHTPPVDAAALRDLLARIGRLAEDLPEVADLDCNPVIVSPDGVIVVDAKLRLAPDPHPQAPLEAD